MYPAVQSALESRLLQRRARRRLFVSSTLLYSISPSPSARPLVPVAARPGRRDGDAASCAIAIIITINVRGPLQTGVLGRHVPNMES